MLDPDAIERMRAMQRDWEANELREFLERQPESRPEYRTGSLLPVGRVDPLDGQQRAGPVLRAALGLALQELAELVRLPVALHRAHPLDRVRVQHRVYSLLDGPAPRPR